jgi:hypothetical protein
MAINAFGFLMEKIACTRDAEGYRANSIPEEARTARDQSYVHCDTKYTTDCFSGMLALPTERGFRC